MRYLIDGYNVLHRMLQGRLTADTLESGRTHLTRRLLKFGSYRHPITVYYDARIRPPAGVPRTQKIGGYIESLFVFSADDSIKARVRKSNPKALAVVTHDRDICSYVGKAGARIVRVIDFIEWLKDEETLDIDPFEPPEKYGL